MQIRRALAWTVFGQVCLFIVQLGGQVGITRLLSPYEIGVYTAGLATTGVLSAIQAVGLNSFVVREKALDDDLLDTVFTINSLISVALATVTFLASFLLGSFLHDRGVLSVLRIMALLPLVAILDFRPNALMQRHMQFRALALTSASRAFASTAATLGFAFCGYSYMSMAWGAVTGAAFGTLILNLAGRRHVGFGLCTREWRRVIIFGAQVLAISGLFQVSSKVSIIVLGRLLGLAELGYFSRADGVVGLLWDNIHGLFARVVLADFAGQIRIGAQTLADRYRTTLAMMTALLWPVFIGLAIFAGPLVNMIYGARWMGSAFPLSLLCLAAAVLITTSMSWEVFVVCGETGAQARIEFARALFGFAAFTAGAFISMPLAAASRILEAAFAQAIYAPRLAKMTGIGSISFQAIYGPGLLATAAAVTPATVLMTAYHWSQLTPPYLIGCTICLGGALWLAVLWWLKHPLYLEGCSIAIRLGFFTTTWKTG